MMILMVVVVLSTCKAVPCDVSVHALQHTPVGHYQHRLARVAARDRLQGGHHTARDVINALATSRERQAAAVAAGHTCMWHPCVRSTAHVRGTCTHTVWGAGAMRFMPSKGSKPIQGLNASFSIHTP